ncbi:MAG: hypothetical protein J0M19_15675 [Sphingomonadales bacterium]|nr:hypothetical protein [Sphingomonadales bacterium]
MRILLAAALFASSTPAFSAVWREADTTHFKIVSAGDEKGLLKFASRLETFHTLLRLATGANEADKPIVKVRVYLVSSIGDVQRLYGNSNGDVAGFYSPRVDGAFAVVPRSTGDGIFTGQLVLFHEYAHHYMLQYTPAAYPSWYVEGFAEIASTASFERAGAITFGKAALHRQYELEAGTSYPVSKMIDGTYMKDRAKGRGWSYGDAWALSHYLTFTDKRRGQFRGYLNGINNGKKMREAAEVFGDLNELQREVGSYLAGGSFPYRAVPIPEGAVRSIKLRELGLAEAALIDMSIEFERRTELPTKEDGESDAVFERRLTKAKQERSDWISKIETIANRNSADPVAWLMLADVRCEIEEFETCETAADRVLAIASGNPRALARKAEAIMGKAADLPYDQRKARVLAAQELLLKANSIDSNDPVALYLFYKSFGKMGVGADSDGLEALLTTVRLVPQLPGPRLTLAQEFMQRGRLREARLILRPLAYSPHENAAALRARALLDEVESKLADT